MAELVALPVPDDETGLRRRVMEAARYACDCDQEVIGYALVVLYDDGGRTTAGAISVETPVINDPLFVSMVCEDVRSHFMTGSAINGCLIADEDC
jgi:hypothetical protein